MSLFREPLFHFLLLGAALFAWFAHVSPPQEAPADPRQIVIDDQDVERLAMRFAATQSRAPTQAEMSRLIQSLLRQEILVREAEALGLEIGDEVIRNRLAQKMTFLLESVAQDAPPDDAALQAYLSDNAEKFTQPALIAFEQVYLGENSDDARRRAVLAELEQGADPAMMGTAISLPAGFPLAPDSRIDGIFGRGFAGSLATLPTAEWSGPVRSAYGAHLVRVTTRQEATLPPLDEIRDSVLNAWMAENADKVAEERFQLLQDRYDIILPAEFQALTKADAS